MNISKFPRKKYQSQGITLVITVGILLMLSIMGVTFVRLAAYERAATDNNALLLDARLTALAGIEQAATHIQERLALGEEIDDTILYPENSDPNLKTAVLNKEDVSLHSGILNGKFSFSGLVGNPENGQIRGRYDFGGNFYALKIESEAGKLNVNGYITEDTTKQAVSNQVLRNILISLANNCGLDDASAAADAIVTRAIENEKRFRSKQEMKDILERLVEDDDAKDEFIRNLTCDTPLNRKTWGVHKNGQREIAEVSSFYREFRAPVNINTISSELLNALIINIDATAVLYSVNVVSDLNDVFGKRLETNIQDNPLTFAIDFSDTGVNVDGIVDEIRSFVPFRDQEDLESFIDDNFTGTTFFPGAPSGVDADEWFQAWQDALKSNFNPNVVEGFWNPNGPSYRRVSRAYLFDRAANEIGQCNPGHTADLSFFNLGPIEIESLARITSENGERTLAEVQVTALIEFGEILHHTSQQDFENGTQVHQNTHTFPNNTRQQQTGNVFDNIAGGVEPRPRPADLGLYDSGDTFVNFQPFKSFQTDGQLLTDFSYFGGTANQGLSLSWHVPPKVNTDQVMTALSIGAATRNQPVQLARNHLTHEGILSRRAQYSSRNASRYFATYAFSQKSMDNSSNNDFRGVNKIDETHLANYQGAIEMWVKLDEAPGDDINPGLSYGILGTTTKNRLRNGFFNPVQEQLADYTQEGPLRNGKFHEGTQMYLYVNSFGKLRLSRLYYAYCFTKEIPNSQTQRHYGTVFPEDLDKSGTLNRNYVRSDVEVDVSGGELDWKAHEWHHIRLTWDDSIGQVELHLDGQLFDDILSPTDGSESRGFTVLNEIDPRDIMFINGYFREEAVAGGYFAFDTQVHYPGNGTIDRFTSYDSTNEGAYASRYFSSSVYQNSFQIPENAILGPIEWVSYSSIRRDPSDYTQNSNVTMTVSVENTEGEILAPYQGAPGIQTQRLIPSTVTSAPKDSVVRYSSNFQVGEKRANDRGLECPTLDSVSLVVLYTSPKYLDISTP